MIRKKIGLLFCVFFVIAAARGDDEEKPVPPEPRIAARNEEFITTVRIRFPRVNDVAQTLRNLYPDRLVWLRPLENSGDALGRIERALARMETLAGAGTLAVSNDTALTQDSVYVSGYAADDDKDKGRSGGRMHAPARQLSKDATLILRQNLDEAEVRRLYGRVKPDDLVFISALPAANALVIRTQNKKMQEELRKIITQLDCPTPQVLLEIRVLRVNITDLQGWGVNFIFDWSDFSFGSSLGKPGEPNGMAFSTAFGNLASNGVTTPNIAGMDYRTDHFGMNIEAEDLRKRITELATPTLLVADNEASKLFIGTEATILQKASKGAIIVGGTTTTTSTTWTVDAPRRNIGLSLVVTPEIHADDTVTIRMNYDNSIVGNERKYYFEESSRETSGTNTVISNETNTEKEKTGFSFSSVDIDTSTVSASIVARNGGIAVIGGLIAESIEKYNNGIPVLSDIPVLGELLFTKTQERRLRNETVILIRPHIIHPADKEAEKTVRKFIFSLSQHPSAKDEIPALGVTSPADVAKLEKNTVSGETPWYKHPVARWLMPWKINITDPNADEHKQEPDRGKNDKIENP